MQKMEENKNLCKFIKDLDQINGRNACYDSSYAVRIKMCDSCRIAQRTNETAQLT